MEFNSVIINVKVDMPIEPKNEKANKNNYAIYRQSLEELKDLTPEKAFYAATRIMTTFSTHDMPLTLNILPFMKEVNGRFDVLVKALYEELRYMSQYTRINQVTYSDYSIISHFSKVCAILYLIWYNHFVGATNYTKIKKIRTVSFN